MSATEHLDDRGPSRSADPSAASGQAGEQLPNGAPHAHVLVKTTQDQVVLIRRIRHGRVYYVVPGVTIGDHETAGAAAERAAREELGISVLVEEIVHAQTFAGADHYFFLAKPDSDPSSDRPAPWRDDFGLNAEHGGSYEIVSLAATQLLAYDVRPWELAKRVCRAARTPHRASGALG